MPDHLHLVLEGTDRSADLIQFVTRFKQRTSYAHSRTARTRLWQDGFYDRVLRKDEATSAAVLCVLANPVRAGLVRAILDWPFSGSDVFSIHDLATLGAIVKTHPWGGP